MCGDLEEDEAQAGQQLYARFLGHARTLLTEQGAPQQSADISSYLDKLFADGLSRSVRDCEQAGDGERYERLSVQPLAFARLAGFLAGHQSLGEDPLRKVIEAVMLGYSEVEAMDHGHDHEHVHGDVPAHDHHH